MEILFINELIHPIKKMHYRIHAEVGKIQSFSVYGEMDDMYAVSHTLHCN